MNSSPNFRYHDAKEVKYKTVINSKMLIMSKCSTVQGLLQWVNECRMKHVDEWKYCFVNWCSASLQQNVIDAAINEWRKQLRAAYMQMDITYRELAMRLKLWTTKLKLTLFIQKKMFHQQEDCDFHSLKVSQGKARTINRWGKKIYTTSQWHIYSAMNVPKLLESDNYC